MTFASRGSILISHRVHCFVRSTGKNENKAYRHIHMYTLEEGPLFGFMEITIITSIIIVITKIMIKHLYCFLLLFPPKH